MVAFAGNIMLKGDIFKAKRPNVPSLAVTEVKGGHHVSVATFFFIDVGFRPSLGVLARVSRKEDTFLLAMATLNL